MNGPIVTIENKLIDLIKTALGAQVKGVASLPGGWDADMLKRLILRAPAVYVAFLGGPVVGPGGSICGISSRWGVYAVTSDPSGQAVRRTGGRGVIGAYEILERAIPAINGQTLDGVGSFELSGSIDNLFSGTLAKQNLTIYEAQFTISLQFEAVPDPGALDDFITFHVDFDLAAPDGEIEGSTDIILEQDP